jgi:hypothetical protein
MSKRERDLKMYKEKVEDDFKVKKSLRDKFEAW